MSKQFDAYRDKIIALLNPNSEDNFDYVTKFKEYVELDVEIQLTYPNNYSSRKELFKDYLVQLFKFYRGAFYITKEQDQILYNIEYAKVENTNDTLTTKIEHSPTQFVIEDISKLFILLYNANQAYLESTHYISPKYLKETPVQNLFTSDTLENTKILDYTDTILAKQQIITSKPISIKPVDVNSVNPVVSNNASVIKNNLDLTTNTVTNNALGTECWNDYFWTWMALIAISVIGGSVAVWYFCFKDKNCEKERSHKNVIDELDIKKYLELTC